MAYTLNYSGGTITVNDGTLNSASTSLSIPGRNYAGYGLPVNQDLVYLVENFAYYTASPPNPIRGQLWYDTSNVLLKYNISSTTVPNWITVAGIGNSVSFANIVATGTITAPTAVITNITSSGTIDANDVNITGTLDVNDVNVTGTFDAVNIDLTGDLSANDVNLTGDLSANDVNLTGDLSAVNATLSGTLDVTTIQVDNLTVGNTITTGVQTGIVATGTVQSTAYAITKDINVISISTPSNNGVRLPATSAGNRITVMNLDGSDSVNVYPAGSAQINSLGASVAYNLAAGGRLDFVSVSSTQWYTLNSTYS